MLCVLRTEFWKQFCTGFLMVAVTVVQIYAGLPIVTYESPSYQNGDSISNYSGWQVENGQASVVDGEGFDSSQALKLHKGTTQNVLVTRDLSIPSGESVAFIDFRVKPAAVPSAGATSTIVVNGTHLSFVKNVESGTGVLYALDGNDDRSGVEEWVDTAHRQSLAGSLSFESQDWIRISVRQDYTEKEWDLYVDGVLYAGGMGFYQRGATLDEIDFYGCQVGDVYLDDLQTDEANMLFVDADKDGIPDEYEVSHGMDTTINDRWVINAEGKTNLGAYMESIWPGYDSSGSSSAGVQTPATSNASGTIPPITILSEHEVVGSLNGAFEVGGNGAASYRIPIDLPTGTGGMVPKLSIGYSSAGGNGVMGLGWDLGGLQRITRGPATKARDGFKDAVDFDADDRFYLEGERLVCIAGTYGADGAEYRTENNSFARIFSRGQLGSGPLYWEIETKAGLFLSFGNCTTSCVQNPSGQGALVWSLNKAEDSVGNYYEVVYEQDGGNPGESLDYRPKEIRYTGNTAAGLSPYSLVKFIYETRQDIRSGYIAGVKVHSTKRMKIIEVRYSLGGTDDGQLLHAYHLSYCDQDITEYPGGWNDFADRSQTRSSLLHKITKTASDETALPPTVIKWGDKYAFTPKTQWMNSSYVAQNRPSWADYSAFMDMNGDGLPDRVDHYNYVTNQQGMWVRLNNGSGFDVPTSWMNSSYVAQNRPSWADYSAFKDMNGDGLPDRVDHYNYTTSQQGMWVRLNNGSGFDAPTSWMNSSNVAQNRPTWAGYSAFMDMNGDGLPDRVDHYNYATNQPGMWVRLNNGSGFDAPTSWMNSSNVSQNQPSWGDYSAFVDMNGDGLPDRVDHYNYATNQPGMWVRLNNGSGFDTPTSWMNSSYVAQNRPSWGDYSTFMDMNGDGLPDRVDHYNYATNQQGMWVRLNTGIGFSAPTSWMNSSYVAQNRPSWADYSAFMDMNGDGLPDRVDHYNYATNQQGMWVRLNNGSGFDTPTSWMNSSYVAQNRPSWADYSAFMDMNGDGLPDRVDHYNYTTSQQGMWVRLNHGNGFDSVPANELPSRERITSFTDGFGAEIKVEYQRFNDPAHVTNSTEPVYTKGDVSTLPSSQIAIKDGRWVVSRFAEEDGLGGWRWTRHHYADLRYDRVNEVSLGFASVKVINEQRGRWSETSYNQTFPYQGMVEHNMSMLADGTVSSDIQNTYAQKPVIQGVDAKVYYLYHSGATESKYDTSGALLATSTTSQTLDDYGSLLTSVITLNDTAQATSWTTTTSNVYQNSVSPTKWHLARLMNTTVVKSGTGMASQTNTSAFTYDNISGLLLSETVEPGNSKSVTMTRLRDTFGNVISTTTSAAGMTSRTSIKNFDSNGRFVVYTENVLGHSTSLVYDQEKSLLLESTDANGLRTSFGYDVFGTKILTTHPHGTQTAEITKRYTGTELPEIAFIRKLESSGSSPTTVYLDFQGRERMMETIGFDGQTIRTESEYDSYGRRSSVSLPYFLGGSPAGWQSFVYDELDRVLSTTYPDGTCDCATYSGFTTVMTNRQNQIRTRVVNANEQLISVTDHTNNTTNFEYFVDGKMKKATGPGGHSVENTFDIFGNKLTSLDSDTGTSTTVYDAFGQIASSTDAKNQIINYTYDISGRALTTVSLEETVTYTYDVASGASLGKLATVSSTTGYHEDYVYDAYGRSISVSRNIAGETFSSQTWFDVLGRISIETDAGGLAVKHHYNALGFEEKVTEVYSGATYWEALEYDASGRLVREELGNGVQTTRTHNNLNGTLTRTQSGIGAVANRHDMEFSWDSVGNLQWRKDHSLGLTENFTYDSLNRVTSAQVVGQSANLFTYDSTGNITSKTGTGSYQYSDSSRPHRLTSITKSGSAVRSFTYDSNGAITGDGRRSYTWTSLNKVSSIHQTSAPVVDSFGGASLWLAGTSDTTFDYDSAGSRIRQTLTRNGVGVNTSSTQRITTYVGSYEREEHYNSSNVLWQIRHRHMVGGYLQIKRTETSGQSGISEEHIYFLKDHLGSTSAVLDVSGNVIERPSFDAWGKTRNASTWADVDADTQWLSSAYTNRGYTGHEQLDESGLIHMNGRIYDPEVGRFLSPDPYIQDAEHSQNFNRYAYVLNNPLSYTDPSGHFFKRLFKNIKREFSKPGVAEFGLGVTVLQKAPKWVKTVAVIVVDVVATYFTGSPIAGAAISGAFEAAINGGSREDMLRGAAVSAASAAITYRWGRNGTNPNKYYAAAGHAIVAGVANETMGGKFEDGFLSSLASSAASSVGPTGTSAYAEAGRTVIQAVAGGTASAIGGGKFANGAYTAAFTYSLQGGISEAFNASLSANSNLSITQKIVAAPFRVVGSMNLLGNIAEEMRTAMIAQSSIVESNSDGTSRNIGAKSVGHRSGGLFRKLIGLAYGGDAIKIGGGRYNLDNLDGRSPLGGQQAGPGRVGVGNGLLEGNYKPGGFWDRVVEAFAGPHDYLSQASYDRETGNIRGGRSDFRRGVDGGLSALYVPLSVPFVVSSLLPTSRTFQ